MISLFASQLIGVFLEAIFYGIYLVAFGACLLPKTFSDHGPGRLRLPLWRLPLVIAWVTIALFVLSTAHFGVGLAEVLRTPRDQKTISQRNWVNTTKGMLSFVLVLLGDSAFIYRCWIIYSKSWLIVTFPIVMWIGVFALVVLFLILQTVSSIPFRVLSKVFRPTLVTLWSLTISLNIYITSVIAYRIWTVDKRSPKSAAVSIAEDHVPLRFIVRIVIESALIYTSASIFAFFVTIFKTNVSFISEFNTQLPGIAFSLILIRLAWYPGVVKELSELAQHSNSFITTGSTDTEDPESGHVELASLNDRAAVNAQVQNGCSRQSAISLAEG